MKEFIDPIARLINQFNKLPAVGGKTAQRYALKILEMSEGEVEEFARVLLDTKKNVKYCSVCGNFTEAGADPCDICRKRDSSVICVVKDAKDVFALEKTGEYEGVYHILGGVLSPLDGIGPEQLRIKELLKRITPEVKEVIVATNPNVEGEATAMYLARILKPLGVKVTRPAQGVSMGSELEYADRATLVQALENRRVL